MSTLIIAEAGVNHNGDIGIAKKMVARAAEAGADFVKFQTFTTEECISVGTPKASYQKKTTDPDENQFDMVRKLELSRADHVELIAECSRKNIGFLSTAFDLGSFDMLVELGVDKVKIPSGEITNLPLLRHVSRLNMSVILSTGMAGLGEIEAAIEIIELAGTLREKITILHCTSEYPTPMEDVNLRAMTGLKAAFDLDVGYSDHTLGIEVPVAAVALGATIIEKHFTLDRSMAGPDHGASLEPDEFGNMVAAIRNIERALGDSVKRPQSRELQTRLIARKSLVAKRSIKPGEIFTEENITAKRPGTGMSPMRWDEVIGKKSPKALSADEFIEL